MRNDRVALMRQIAMSMRYGEAYNAAYCTRELWRTYRADISTMKCIMLLTVLAYMMLC